MAIDLVTLEEYKAYATIASTNSDVQIEALIPRVSALVKKLCRRTFVDYVDDFKIEYHEGGAPFLVPEEYPILSVASLEYSSDYGNTYTELVEFTDYTVSTAEQCIKAINTNGFTAAHNAYKLTYTAGFEAENFPEDLKLAVFDLITYYIKNDASIHSTKAPGTNSVQIEYVTTTGLPAHIKRILDQYMANYS